MGLIKLANSPSQLQRFSMTDIENQARAILARARQQAEQLLAATQAQATQILQQGRAVAEAARTAARAEGRAEGIKQGSSEGRAEGLRSGHEEAMKQYGGQLAEVLKALTGLAGGFDAHRQQLEVAATKDVIDLAVAIAQRVTKRMGEVDSSVAVANVQEAIKLVGRASDIRLAVAPQQKEMLEKALPEMRLQWPQFEHVALVEDAALRAGGCRIYSERGEIDADLEGQLQRIVADLVPERQETIA